MPTELADTNIFFSQSAFGKEKTRLKFYLPLSTEHYRGRSRRADFGKNSYLMPASASFPGSRLQALSEYGVLASPIMGRQIVGEEK